ncbi:hypothetical protein QAD02_021036 [Eretmocerus hayati]|uniref:Uncharacterized protein n=1 Tax=Eretmocerus hayati TaxID=131215 RepID=A0ACC2PQF3_9HYME|nr:hypothetical protein QAD02_021036 [Eretmocerus hayati]
MGNRILEAQHLQSGTVDNALRTACGQNLLDCFRRGLKATIEYRLPAETDINESVTNANEIERQLEAQSALRQLPNTHSEKDTARKPGKRDIYSCATHLRKKYPDKNCYM